MTSEPDQHESPEHNTASDEKTVEPKAAVPSDARVERAPAKADDSEEATETADYEEETGSKPIVENAGEGAEANATAAPGTPAVHPPSPEPTDAEPAAESVESANDEVNEAVLAQSRRHTRRSFVVASAAAAAGYGFYRWIDSLPAEARQQEGYRKAFEANANISRAVFDDRGLSPTYPLSKAENLRVNGVYGLKKMLDPASYRLQLVGSTTAASHPRYTRDVTAWNYVYIDEKTMEDQGHDTKTPPPSARTSEKMAPVAMVEQERKNEDRSGRMPRGKEEAGESFSTLPVGTPGLLLKMEDVLKLPRQELVTQFKCIEGWSQIVHWAGIRMADLIEAYPPALIEGREPKYVYMETPDGDYYNGYDLHVCRHPQTLLVTEMMGTPLTQYHGAPLRLHMPTKYGYKQIKRIGLISYTNAKPDDYWTKLGYDWYAGL